MKLISSCLHIALLLPIGPVDGSAATPSAQLWLSSLKSMDYRYFVAGGTCAAISHGITTPIDVVKTRIQADPKKFDKGMGHAAVLILKEDGPKALLGGFGPTVVGYGIEGRDLATHFDAHCCRTYTSVIKSSSYLTSCARRYNMQAP
jgi:hypothetical protein